MHNIATYILNYIFIRPTIMGKGVQTMALCAIQKWAILGLRLAKLRTIKCMALIWLGGAPASMFTICLTDTALSY